MAVKVTRVIVDYLECIYRLQRKYGVARTSEMVRSLHVVPGTVTNTVKRLERAGLVNHQPYKGVKLTEKGRKIALGGLRKHRLSERLLTDILHINWVEAHKVACKLEHSLTDDVIKKLDEVLNYPKTCPHGNPIPTKWGVIPEEDSEPLTNLDTQEKGVIVKIIDEDSRLLRYITTLGLKPGVLIEVVDKAPFKGPITIESDEESHALGRNVALKIWVKKHD